jgi:hypothetical protein
MQLRTLAAVAAIALGIGVVIGVVISGSEAVRPLAAPKSWRTFESLTPGVHATLKTEWRDGDQQVSYQLRVFPHDPSLAKAFDALAGIISSKGAILANLFEVHLQNSQGFELCAVNRSAGNVVPERDNTGQIVALVEKGTGTECNFQNYQEAQEWAVTSLLFPKALSDVSRRLTSGKE